MSISTPKYLNPATRGVISSYLPSIAIKSEKDKKAKEEDEEMMGEPKHTHDHQPYSFT